MATTRHSAYRAALANVLTTELNSLAVSAVSAASAEFDNGTDRDLFVDLQLNLAVTALRAAGGIVAVHLISALDGSTYDTVDGVVAEQVAGFQVSNAITAFQATRRDVPIPPGKWKMFVRNGMSVAMASSGNTLKYRAHTLEVV